MENYRSHIDYLRAKVLWDHLQELSTSNNTSQASAQEISDGLTYVSAMSMLGGINEEEDSSVQSVGGVTSNDIVRYGERRDKLSESAMSSLLESLDNTLADVVLYYHAVENLDQEKLHSLALSLVDHIQGYLTRKDLDIQELSTRLSIVLDLYQEAAEVHPRLETSLRETIETLPPLVKAHHSASYDMLALTIESFLLKLSAVRARICESLYGHTSSSNPHATMSNAISHLQTKIIAQQQVLEAKGHDVHARLQEYQQLLELVDGPCGFAQVVEDLATVRRETEECRKDLRRLGWTET